jgi:peptidoglycan/LPS O-acetylase OafA/YrhL
MLGIMRTLLAILVMVNHIPGNHAPFSYSAIAVIGFFFISGFLMQRSYGRFVNEGSRPSIRFYLDRLIRLYPLYFLSVALSFVLTWHSASLSKSELIVNFSLVMLPFAYMREGFPLVNGPTWSLATEMVFYVFVPLLFWATRVRYVAAAIGVTLALCHVWGMTFDGQLIDRIPVLLQWLKLFSYDKSIASASELLVYRGPFFAISVFMLGVLVGAGNFFAAAAVYSIYLVFFMIVGQFGSGVDNTYSLEVCLGVLVLAPALYSASKPEPVLRVFNQKIGMMAYPIFLFHFPFIEYFEGIGVRGRPLFILVIVATLLLSVLAALLQYQIDRYRTGVRGFRSMRVSGGLN